MVLRNIFVKLFFFLVSRENSQPVVTSDVFKDSISDDPFTSSLHMSDLDRRQDAWIPSDATRHIIVTVLTSPPGTYEVLPEQLSTPGLYLEEPQVNICNFLYSSV